jgi:hypothetical protein
MTNRHYINNKSFYEEMIKFKNQCEEAKVLSKPTPVISNYIGQCFLHICGKLSTKSNFVNYTYRDEMISDGIENCIMAVYSFDPVKSNNPFAYFTQIAWNAFIRRIHKEKKQQYVKHKNFQDSMLLVEPEYGNLYQNDNHSNDIINTFEEKITKKQRRKKR